MSERLFGALIVALSATCFGAMAIFAKFAYLGGADVVAVLSMRFTIAAVVMWLVMRQRGIGWPRKANLRLLMVMGGLCYVAQSFSFFSALNYASAALVALLLYLHPFIVTLFGARLFGQALTRVRIACVLTALAGTALVIGADVSGQPLGVALGILAALLYSVYLLIGNRVMRNENPLAAATVVMISAAAVFCVFALITRPAFPQTVTSWAAVFAIAVVSTAIAMVTLFIGIRHLGAADAATLSTLEPLVTALLGALLLDERLSTVQWIGGLVIVVAVVVLARHGAVVRPVRAA